MAEVDAGAGELRSGRRVRVRVRSHPPYGLAVEIVGHEGIGASVDWLDIAGPRRGRPRPGDFPVGAEIEAVIRNRLKQAGDLNAYPQVCQELDRGYGHPPCRLFA